MKTKVAYLRGLMDGLKLADDDNTRVLKAIADCLEAMADEIETESARTDAIEAELDEINEDIDDLDEVLGFLLEEEEDEDDEENWTGEDWEDDFDFFTCPSCGKVVPLDEETIQEQPNPLCPECGKPLFGE